MSKIKTKKCDQNKTKNRKKMYLKIAYKTNKNTKASSPLGLMTILNPYSLILLHLLSIFLPPTPLLNPYTPTCHLYFFLSYHPSFLYIFYFYTYLTLYYFLIYIIFQPLIDLGFTRKKLVEKARNPRALILIPAVEMYINVNIFNIFNIFNMFNNLSPTQPPSSCLPRWTERTAQRPDWENLECSTTFPTPTSKTLTLSTPPHRLDGGMDVVVDVVDVVVDVVVGVVVDVVLCGGWCGGCCGWM